MENENVAQSNIDATTETAETVNASESAETAAAKTETNTTDKTTETAKVVPETYADFILPEGFTMDSKALEEFLPMAKELGMTQEAAQKAITMHANAIQGVLQKQAEFREEKFKEVMAEVKADKDLGGAKFDENIGKINAVLNKFGGEGTSDTFLQAVAQMAAFDSGKAKALYATMDKIARAASIDTHLVKGGTVTDPRPLANQIFDESLKDL